MALSLLTTKYGGRKMRRERSWKAEITTKKKRNRKERKKLAEGDRKGKQAKKVS